MLKTLFTHLLFRKDDILLMDMYAGVEHLGRATVDFVDTMLVVVEPTRRSLATANQIKKAGRRHRSDPPVVGGEQDPESRGRVLPRAGGGRPSPCWGTFPTIRASSKRIAGEHRSTLWYLR